MQSDVQVEGYNGTHIEVKAVKDYKFLNSSYVCAFTFLEKC